MPENTPQTESVKRMDLMGRRAMRGPACMEGESKYNFRIL